MNKKSIVNDLYHASLISVFAVGYSMLGKKILKVAPPSIQKFDLEDTGKLIVIVAASEIPESILLNRRSYQITSMSKKMASVAMLIGGALENALAFTGSSYLFSTLSKDSIDKERKRHNLAIEKLQKAQFEWGQKRQQRIDFSNKQLRLE